MTRDDPRAPRPRVERIRESLDYAEGTLPEGTARLADETAYLVDLVTRLGQNLNFRHGEAHGSGGLRRCNDTCPTLALVEESGEDWRFTVRLLRSTERIAARLRKEVGA